MMEAIKRRWKAAFPPVPPPRAGDRLGRAWMVLPPCGVACTACRETFQAMDVVLYYDDHGSYAHAHCYDAKVKP